MFNTAILFCKKLFAKVFALKNLTVSALVAFFTPAFYIFVAAQYMIFLDFICAIIVGRIQKTKFESGLAWKTPGKMFLVLMVFTGIRTLDIGLQDHVGFELPGALQLSVWFCALVSVAELFSINETFEKLMGYSFLALIQDKLGMITKYIKFTKTNTNLTTNLSTNLTTKLDNEPKN